MNIDIIGSAIAKVKSLAWVKGVAELNPQQRTTIEDLENEAMKNVLGGMGKGRNEGVKDVLSKDVVLALFTDPLFKIPRDKNLMELVCKGEVVGFPSMNPAIIEEYKKDKNYIVLSNFFIIRRDAKLTQASFANGESCLIIHGTKLTELEDTPEIKDHILAIPSPPVFDFLHILFKEEMNLLDPRLGGLLLGFNLPRG